MVHTYQLNLGEEAHSEEKVKHHVRKVRRPEDCILPFLLRCMFTRDPAPAQCLAQHKTLKRIVTSVECVKATEEELERLSKGMCMRFDDKDTKSNN